MCSGSFSPVLWCSQAASLRAASRVHIRCLIPRRCFSIRVRKGAWISRSNSNAACRSMRSRLSWAAIFNCRISVMSFASCAIRMATSYSVRLSAGTIRDRQVRSQSEASRAKARTSIRRRDFASAATMRTSRRCTARAKCRNMPRVSTSIRFRPTGA